MQWQQLHRGRCREFAPRSRPRRRFLTILQQGQALTAVKGLKGLPEGMFQKYMGLERTDELYL